MANTFQDIPGDDDYYAAVSDDVQHIAKIIPFPLAGQYAVDTSTNVSTLPAEDGDALVTETPRSTSSVHSQILFYPPLGGIDFIQDTQGTVFFRSRIMATSTAAISPLDVIPTLGDHAAAVQTVKVLKVGSLSTAILCIVSLALWLCDLPGLFTPFAAWLFLLATPFFYLMGVVGQRQVDRSEAAIKNHYLAKG